MPLTSYLCNSKGGIQIMKRVLFLFVIFISVFLLSSNSLKTDVGSFPYNPEYKEIVPFILHSDTLWADSVLTTLTMKEKIGQLLMVAAYSNKNQSHVAELSKLIRDYKIGGLIFFQGGPVRQANMINHFQEISQLPLMIAMDAEWGLGMRLDSTISYPMQMMLGAIQDDALIYQMGYDIGRQLRRVGVHINFAPVVDVNNNPMNPVINSRSFGEDRLNVARKGLLYSQGLRDAGVVAAFKHFPGHGDTDTDSHLSLPVIKHNLSRLDSLELFPFKYGIENGISGIMSAHLSIPALDSTPNLPSSLSTKIIRDFLRSDLKFDGLVFTDALGMKGVSSYFKPGETEAMAFMAGNDVLLMPQDVPKAINGILNWINEGKISEQQLNKSCRRILLAKSWLKLKEEVPVKTDSLYEELNLPEYLVLKRSLIKNSLTLLRNNGNLIPFDPLDSLNFISLAIGNGEPDDFTETLSLYTKVDNVFQKKDEIFDHRVQLKDNLKGYNTLIVSIQNTSQWPGKFYGLSSSTLRYLNELEFEGRVVLCVFGNPYILSHLTGLDNFDAILLCYDDERDTKELAAQALFGASVINGKIPVSPIPTIPKNTGIQAKEAGRLSYGLPEEAGMNSSILEKIDSIALDAIINKATPGCQVLVSRNNKVIFRKAYGSPTYSGDRELSNEDLFDIASITKISATIPSLMRLYDQGKLDINKSLGDYLDIPDTCNKKNLVISDILAHQAGLQAWIPFYLSTIEPMDSSEAIFSSRYSADYPDKIGKNVYANRNIQYKDSIYSNEYSMDYPTEVAQNLFIRKDYPDTITKKILGSDLLEKKYRYSDLGYYFFKRIIEGITDTSLYSYVYYNFYSKIGATTMGYLPLNRYPKERIVPTENDVLFRRQLIQGYVHDPGAAMLGGIGGHAGIFTNANDLAKMMQVYLNHGSYGGYRFFSDTVVARFTNRAFTSNGNRRGLGFDKPELDRTKIGPTCKDASVASYGHSGFTGTLAWMDPDYNLCYIFLSNRIHPNQENSKLIEMDVRTKIQQVIYDSIIR